MALYDEIGRSYRRTRQPDPRIAAAMFTALGEADSVVNVGAGAGAYEPPQTALAVEPSRVLINARPARHPVVQGVAEATQGRDSGFIGAPWVNVLDLNLSLDEEFGTGC